MKRLFNKKVVAVGVAAGLTLGMAGAALAYFTTTGAGTGDTTAGSNSGSITLHADIAGNILPGDGGQSVTFTGDNSNQTTTLWVDTISFVSVTSTDSDCQAVIDADPSQFSMDDVTSHTPLAAKASGATVNGTGTLIWDNSDSLDQTPCAGAPLTLHVSSN